MSECSACHGYRIKELNNQTDSLSRMAPFNPAVHRSSFGSVHGNTERLGALVPVCSICRRNEVFFCLCIMHWARSDSEEVLLWCDDRESPPPQLRARKGRHVEQVHSRTTNVMDRKCQKGQQISWRDYSTCRRREGREGSQAQTQQDHDIPWDQSGDAAPDTRHHFYMQISFSPIVF